MKDENTKEEEQLPKGNRRGIVGWGWISVRGLGLDDPSVDMVKGREVSISSRMVEAAPEVGAIEGRLRSKGMEPLEGLEPLVWISMSVTVQGEG